MREGTFEISGAGDHVVNPRPPPPPNGPASRRFSRMQMELCVCKCDVIWRRNDLTRTRTRRRRRKHACSESRPVIMEPKDRRDECWHEHHKRLNLRRIPHMQRNQRRDPGRNTRRRRAPPYTGTRFTFTHTPTHAHTPRTFRGAAANSARSANHARSTACAAASNQRSGPNRVPIAPKCGLTFGSRYRRARGGCTCPISCRSGRGWSRSA